MTETVVHVETLKQWKSVLDVWFAQGYKWFASGCDYSENAFEYRGSRQLALNVNGIGDITCFSHVNKYSGDNLLEYADFMAQQEKTMDKKKNGNVMVELSQFMVAAIIQKCAQFDEYGDLIVDADEYSSLVVEGTPVSDKGENNG
ncbi:hypothetical protein [Leuconostoc citreum]|uniref:hypothetical protein n=1 Tax=Leuconostoc citreum TaxID=33964 RepID=UPI0032DFCFFF